MPLKDLTIFSLVPRPRLVTIILSGPRSAPSVSCRHRTAALSRWPSFDPPLTQESTDGRSPTRPAALHPAEQPRPGRAPLAAPPRSASPAAVVSQDSLRRQRRANWRLPSSSLSKPSTIGGHGVGAPRAPPSQYGFYRVQESSSRLRHRGRQRRSASGMAPSINRANGACTPPSGNGVSALGNPAADVAPSLIGV